MVAHPQVLTAASLDMAGIGSAISEANALAAGSITGVETMAADDVSAAISTLFRTYAKEYQALTLTAAAFQDEFSSALAAAGNAYAGMEAVSGGALGALTAPVQALLASASRAVSGVAGAAGMNAPARPASAVSLIMGASGQPIPPQSYIDAATRLFISPFSPNSIPQAQFTPEGFYTWSGLKVLPIDTSISQGAAILAQSIQQQITAGNTPVTVFGYSQSTVVAGVAMDLLAQQHVPSSDVNFVLVGPVGAPNGGIVGRFPGLSFPSLGLTFGGSIPSNLFPTRIYTLEYDGWADFPQYPLNLPADINALMGMLYVHPHYLQLTANQITPVADGGQAIQLATQGPTQTTYYMIPTPNLPLLEPLRAVPILGNPLADLIQPDLRVIVNLGYGNPDFGWSQGPANVPTPFGLFPNVDPIVVAGDLGAGAQEGIGAFVHDITAGGPPSLPALTLPNLSGAIASNPLQVLTALPAPNPANLASSIDTAITDIQAASTAIVNGVTNASAAAYSILAPTADITNALVTTLPAYDLSLFLDGIKEVVAGNPAGIIHAIGYPIAANVALVPFLGLLELTSIMWAAGFTATVPTS
jgi:hypothetical protein